MMKEAFKVPKMYPFYFWHNDLPGKIREVTPNALKQGIYSSTVYKVKFI